MLIRCNTIIRNSHPGKLIFEGIKFRDIIEKKVDPEFKPKLTSKDDLQNFDKKFTRLSVRESVIPEHKMKIINEKKEQFENF